MSKLIYIVDDDYFGRQALSELVHIYLPAAVIEQMTDGAQCLQRVMAQTPDLIFLDCYMPEMDGLEVAMALSAWPDRNAFMLVGMSGVEKRDESIAEMRLLCDAWLQKPFTLHTISDILDQIAGGE